MLKPVSDVNADMTPMRCDADNDDEMTRNDELRCICDDDDGDV